jgi:uncharacterized SAM-binding protein YcdF (DUF218 family)
MSTVFLIKIVSALIYPLGLAFVCALLSSMFYLKRRRLGANFLAGVSVIILVLSSNPLVARNLVYSLERQHPQQALESIRPHDAIIVLGGGLRIPSPPARHVQLGLGSDRYWYAARLYKSGKAKKIILSGGNLYPQNGLHSEAFYAAELLQQWGVPKAAIVLELGSRTTLENRENTAKILKSEGFQPTRYNDRQRVLLVTSAIHMPRAFYLFKKIPVLVTPASADVMIRQQSAPTIFSLIPSASALNLTTVALHEYYGLWYELLKSRIRSKKI